MKTYRNGGWKTCALHLPQEKHTYKRHQYDEEKNPYYYLLQRQKMTAMDRWWKWRARRKQKKAARDVNETSNHRQITHLASRNATMAKISPSSSPGISAACLRRRHRMKMTRRSWTTNGNRLSTRTLPRCSYKISVKPACSRMKYHLKGGKAAAGMASRRAWAWGCNGVVAMGGWRHILHTCAGACSATPH